MERVRVVFGLALVAFIGFSISIQQQQQPSINNHPTTTAIRQQHAFALDQLDVGVATNVYAPNAAMSFRCGSIEPGFVIQPDPPALVELDKGVKEMRALQIVLDLWKAFGKDSVAKFAVNIGANDGAFGGDPDGDPMYPLYKDYGFGGAAVEPVSNFFAKLLKNLPWPRVRKLNMGAKPSDIDHILQGIPNDSVLKIDIDSYDGDILRHFLKKRKWAVVQMEQMLDMPYPIAFERMIWSHEFKYCDFASRGVSIAGLERILGPEGYVLVYLNGLDALYVARKYAHAFQGSKFTAAQWYWYRARKWGFHTDRKMGLTAFKTPWGKASAARHTWFQLMVRNQSDAAADVFCGFMKFASAFCTVSDGNLGNFEKK